MSRVYFYSGAACALAMVATPGLCADSAKTFDAATAFGARTDIGSVRLSPDGLSVAFVTAMQGQGQGSVVYTVGLAPGAKAKVAFYADGKPFRLRGCNWVANDRLVCATYGVVAVPDPKNSNVPQLRPLTRLTAMNADGTKPQQLSAQQNDFVRGVMLLDTTVIDWLPDQDGSVLLSRTILPNHPQDSKIGSFDGGLGVDLVDTRTLAVKHVVPPRAEATEYLSDGRGTIRIVGERSMQPGPGAGATNFLYRKSDSLDWQKLSTYNPADHSGFQPIAVDHDLNLAYGWKKLNGHLALYSMSLDGSLREQLVYSQPDMDLDGLIRIGRRNRAVGVSYVTNPPGMEYFSDDIKPMLAAVHSALPQKPLLSVIDSSADESKLLFFVGSETDPGAYYMLDRQTHSLRKFLGTRAALEAATLATVKPVSYPAADGTMIPAYLTLPPGVDNPKGLPAIVVAPGNATARDASGFDWLAQFYAARGYVVLQPSFRGSAGYGDAWYLQNGLKAWETAVGDTVAAGHWLVTQGMADPAKLGIVGWSYGGYAALQSVNVDPGLFKAIVAIAPVTDLAALKNEHGLWSDYFGVSDFVATADNMREASPLTHADKFKQPVLLFHGTLDRNVSIAESKSMVAALKAAGAKSELVTFDDRDHDLEDSVVRADMLRKSDAFLRQSFGMSP
jgi:dipeptidyl aminopeptidase/acylaminoacyl peptidase